MISSLYNKSSNEKLEIENAYGARKSGNVTEYNFDINKMIKDFSFYDFIDQTRGGKKDNGAFLVVTDKQYILGYNADYGLGSHQQSFARCEAELEGGKKIGGYPDCVALSTKCEDSFITAKILYIYMGDNENSSPMYDGKIIFTLGDRKITPEQMEVFKKLYEDKKAEINGICSRYSFSICFSYKDETGKSHSDYSNNLDGLIDYLKTAISYDIPKTSKEDEKIIGVPLEQNYYK